MRPSRRILLRIAAVGGALAVSAGAIVLVRHGAESITNLLLSNHGIPQRTDREDEGGAIEDERTDLHVTYPRDGTVFPPELPPPSFAWKGRSGTTGGHLSIELPDGEIAATAEGSNWTPTDEQWDLVRQKAVGKKVTFTVSAVSTRAGAPPEKATVGFGISKDEVGAPLFYREVNLPFIEAVKDPSSIRWRFGSIASKVQPPVVLDKMPVCANCHSFSANGSSLAMDVDYANDKGSYIVAQTEPRMVLAKGDIITWSDYRRQDKAQTFGLLSQVSPDGRYVISTVKDRSVFVAAPDIAFSQLFFPIKGILCVYSLKTGEFRALPGADDPAYVQSNPSWSPDGKHIVFARSKAHQLRKVRSEQVVLLTDEECKEFLKEGRTFAFDLYRIPFNDGKGGKPEPLAGASGDGRSNYFAKYSPDGKWIVFCKARSFMLLQPDSELYIVPAEGGRARRLQCNTKRMNSWHTWSPNGKWMVFSSKENGPYTQLFLTHIDEDGNSTPAVLLAHLTSKDRAANIPEFVNARPDAILSIREQFLDAVSYVRAGNEFRFAGDLNSAEAKYRTALSLDPRNADANMYLGFILMTKGAYDKSREHLLEAVSISPKEPEAYFHLGVVAAQQGKADEAIRFFRTALVVAPEYPLAHAGLGMIMERQGRIDEAIVCYTEAVRLDPTMAMVQSDLGMLLLERNSVNEAVLRLGGAVRLKSDDGSFRHNLAIALGRQGKPEEAIIHGLEAVRLLPASGPARRTVGTLLLSQGRLEDAARHLLEALRLEPADAKTVEALRQAMDQAVKQGKVGLSRQIETKLRTAKAR